ncbi:hypothetical protein LC593_23440 [Nostoc sp. CHAB 5844]|nr:hypothetical protein [Nostoc sp. CHAB 5844]
MSFRAIPQSIVQVGKVDSFNIDREYFCTICLTASGEARKIPGKSEQFVDVKITKAQALQLRELLQMVLEE